MAFLREVAISVSGGFLASEGFSEEVLYGGGEAETLDALRAPLGRDLVAGRAPDFLCVALEEGEIEFTAKAIDKEVFKAVFGLDLA